MDEVIKSRFHYQEHTGVLTHETTQPTEKLILDRNAELRKNKGAVNDLGIQSGGSWGRQVASIPFITYAAALKYGYELNSKDSKHAAAEMQRFLATDVGKACLIVEKL